MDTKLQQDIENAIKVLKSKQTVISQSETQALIEILAEVIKPKLPQINPEEMSPITSSDSKK